MGLSLAAGFHRDGFFNPSPIFRKGRRGDRIDHNPALAPTFGTPTRHPSDLGDSACKWPVAMPE